MISIKRLLAFTSVLYCLIFSGSINGQKSVMDNAGEKLQKFNAHQAFLREDYKKALTYYKDLYGANQSDGELAYWVGACYWRTGDKDNALTYLEKANAINAQAHKDLPLDLGKVYLAMNNIDNAATQFELYKKNAGGEKTIKDSDVDNYINQCKIAKDLQANPINVTITNLGDIVNSEFDDKRPSISADGKKMVFTSRRPRDKDSYIDKEGDGKYFEDIYLAEWDSVKKMWGDPDLISGAMNTEFHDAACSISPDGKQIFVYKNDDVEARGGDIYVSRLSQSGKWGTPKPMGRPINTTYWEDGACLSPDGNTLYFISEREGKTAQGKGDIYYSKRKSKVEWEEPVNMGPVINTAYDEGGVYIAADGKTLFFCSEGHGSMGSYDIFKTVFENGAWTKPVNVGYPINTVGAEKSFILSTDGKTAHIASDRKGSLGERDIYKVDLTNYPILEKEPGKVKSNAPSISILKGTVINAEGASGLQAELNIFDEAGEKVGNTVSSIEGGEYFITLTGNKNYTVKIDLKGYKPLEEKFLLATSKDGSTYTQVRHFILYKK